MRMPSHRRPADALAEKRSRERPGHQRLHPGNQGRFRRGEAVLDRPEHPRRRRRPASLRTAARLPSHPPGVRGHGARPAQAMAARITALRAKRRLMKLSGSTNGRTDARDDEAGRPEHDEQRGGPLGRAAPRNGLRPRSRAEAAPKPDTTTRHDHPARQRPPGAYPTSHRPPISAALGSKHTTLKSEPLY